MSVNGIYGLSGSGLDIESMVKVGMMSKQSQYEKMQQTYTKNEWKKEAFLDIYDKVNSYTSTVSTFTRSNNVNARNATSTNSLISVSADSTATTMTHNLTVNSTATNAYFVGTSKLDKLPSLLNIQDNDSTTKKTISFTLDDGITSDDTLATATFSGTENTTLNENLFESALLNVLARPDSTGATGTAITGIKTFTSGTDTMVRFSYDYMATDDGGDEYDSSASRSLSSTATAMSFKVNETSIDVTYGDIAKLFVEPDYEFSFTDFVSMLNEKMEDKGLNGITASYSAEGKGSLTFTNYNNGGTVTAELSNGGGVANEILKSLGVTASNGAAKALTADQATDSNSNVISTGLGTATTVSLEVSSSTSYYDLVSAINNAGTNIRATYDSVNGTFSMYNSKSGSNNIVSINIANSNSDVRTNTATVFNAMGLVQSKGTTSSDNKLTFSDSKTSAVIAGTDASVVLDGVAYTKDSNSFTEKGVTYNISSVTEKTSASVTVTQDTEKIVENVKSFVESYNQLLSDLYDAYNETPNSSYAPLTDAQKAEMTEEQIEKWEEKAKSGLLYHDSTIRKIIDNMRSAISSNVDSVNSDYNNAYSLGISTKGIYGQLTLDEDKLKTALSNDPDAVQNVFATLKSTADDRSKATYLTKDGIAQRLGDIMNSAVKSINNVAGRSSDISEDSQLNNLLRNLQTKMSSFRSMMDAFENNLYKKYDAMESTLAMLGTQLNYVTSSFA